MRSEQHDKDAFHFDLREKKEDNGKQSYLFDVYYENATGTLNVLMDKDEPVIAALNLSLGKVITLSNDINLKKLCKYVIDQVNA